MFFKKKPIPPEWSHLTPKELSFCRQLERRSRGYAYYEIFKRAVSDRAYGALPIILPGTGIYADDCIRYAFQSGDVFVINAIIPALSNVEPNYQLYFLADQRLQRYPQQLSAILEQITNPSMRARGIIAQLNNGSYVTNDQLALLKSIIDAGVDINHDKGSLLFHALRRRQYALSEKIIKAGFDLKKHGPAVYKKLTSRNGGSAEARRWLSEMLAKRDIALPTPVSKSKRSPFKMVADHSVKLVEDLGNQTTLTRVFNFASGEQVMYVKEGARLSPPASVAHSVFENRTLLQEAIAAFVDQGGASALVERFAQNNNLLAKPRVPTPAAKAAS